MSVYEYNEFENAAKKAGLYDTFSASDLKLAQSNPDAGMSILQFKQDYRNAETDEMRALANAGAENIRASYGNYTGGADGSGFHLDDPSPIGFHSDAAPTYTSFYKDQIKQTLGDVTATPAFSYDEKSDPLYSAYRKQYAREGKRATEDTLGTVAAASGGIPSSYAATAASQAGDYYAAQAADKLPELYQVAYEKYLNDYKQKFSNLDALQKAEQTDYDRYLNDLSKYNTDRSFDYAQYLDEIAQNTAERAEAKSDADRAASYGDYSLLRNLGINPSVAERESALSQAKTAAEYGDYSALQALGVDTAALKRSRALEEAITAAKYGDYSALQALGINTSSAQYVSALENAVSTAKYGDYSQLEAMGIDTSSAVYAKKLENAVNAAEYGDYTQLEALGIDTGKAKEKDVWSRAEEAAKYGDFSQLAALGVDTEVAKEKYKTTEGGKFMNPLTNEQVRSLLINYPDGILPSRTWTYLICTIDGLTAAHLREAGFQRQT